MSIVLLIITWLILAFMVGVIRTLQGRVDSLESNVEILSLKTHHLEKKLAQAQEPVVIPEEPEPFYEEMVGEPILISRDAQDFAEPPKPFPSHLFTAALPPVLEPSVRQTPEAAAPPPLPSTTPPTEFNWEQFLGAKMMAWLGGLALFVGIAFFVKYSFDRDLVPPWVRVVLGFAFGAGLVIAGMKIRKKDYLITAQTFVATGVVILYAVSFISRSLYHLINTPVLFLLMSGITIGAFTLAIRMDARVVAVLGMLGGFLTPLFVGFSREQPLPLLGYVLVLNCGLLTVARRKDWSFLIPLAAIATFLTQIAWIITSLNIQNLVPTLLMIGALTALFVANARFNPDPADEPRSLFAGTLQSFVVLGVFWFVLYQQGGTVSPVILLSTLFFGNIALIALYSITVHVLPLIAAVSACGGLLALWINKSPSVLSACIAALIYASLNALLPAWIAKWRDSSRFWPNVASVAGLGLMLLVLFGNANPGWFFWSALLLLNMVLLTVALLRRNLALALCGTISTAVLSVYWIVHLDSSNSLVQPLLIIGAFALLYFFAAGPLSRRLDDQDPTAIYFPAVPAAIPFLLLALLMVRLDIENPSLLFGFAMLLNALLIFASPKVASAFTLIALIGSLLLQALWFTGEMSASNAGVSFAWFLAFSLLFTVTPLLRKRTEPLDWLPWYVSAAAGPIHFGLLYATAKIIWPGMSLPGLIPALLGLPALGMFLLMRQRTSEPAHFQRFTGIYGASLLFFVTLIFPIQFDRQWLTLSWALEGAALFWLNRRAPAQWLVALGSVLLAIAFSRLAVNPLVFKYYERGAVPIFNWYLYSYGIVSALLFIAARLLTKSEFSHVLKGAFCTMGTVLLFLLINIEIADLFAQGPYLTFEFSGNFARDMTYSIAWSLFALALLIIGVKREAPIIRYAGLGLMGVTLLKLFLHDLTQLDALFRIGAFIGVAIILIFASWMYQRFLSPSRAARDSTARPVETP